MRTCKAEGCRNPVWSHGYCNRHGYLRTDEKKPKPMNKTRKPTGELAMFLSIWEDRISEDGKHRSEISGKELDGYFGTKLFPNLFLHVLPKGTYPELRLQENNIIMGTPYEHILVDSSYQQQREAYEKENNCSFKIFYDKREQLKQQYNDNKRI
jgi:hypothetical protein